MTKQMRSFQMKKNIDNNINSIYNGFGVATGSGKSSSLNIVKSMSLYNKNSLKRDVEIVGLIHEEIKTPKKEKNKEIKSKDFGLSLI